MTLLFCKCFVYNNSIHYFKWLVNKFIDFSMSLYYNENRFFYLSIDYEQIKRIKRFVDLNKLINVEDNDLSVLDIYEIVLNKEFIEFLKTAVDVKKD